MKFNSDFKYLSDISLMNQCGNAVNVEVVYRVMSKTFLNKEQIKDL